MGRSVKEIAGAQELDQSASRDFVMARLYAARVCAQGAVEAIDEAIAYFVDPDEDDEGEERTELIESALENAGMATRALESASEAMEAVDPEECEPWDDGAEEIEDEAPEPPPRATARKRR